MSIPTNVKILYKDDKHEDSPISGIFVDSRWVYVVYHNDTTTLKFSVDEFKNQIAIFSSVLTNLE